MNYLLLHAPYIPLSQQRYIIGHITQFLDNMILEDPHIICVQIHYHIFQSLDSFQASFLLAFHTHDPTHQPWLEYRYLGRLNLNGLKASSFMSILTYYFRLKVTYDSKGLTIDKGSGIHDLFFDNLPNNKF